MSYVISAQHPVPRPTKRYKTSLACSTCRRRKLKCDGGRPACGRCQDKDSLGDKCTYIPCIDSRSTESSHPYGAAGIAPPPNSSAPAVSTLNTEQPAVVKTNSVDGDANPTEFASTFKAAIDAILGLPAARKRCPIPLTDAPLFGERLSRRQTTDVGIQTSENLLPPRKHTDHLISLYWRYLEPLEPLLNQKRFSHSYHMLFTGSELDCDERVFVSTLNVIFALSTQLQESSPPEQRDEESKTFFQRAWSLLRPETILWEPGSLELIQCLLLMGRYLQCTRNLHQTWMAVGSALRIAQSLGLHSPNQSSSGDGRSGRQIWQCCVSMDRALSWSLGRTSTASLAASSFSFDLRYNGNGDEIPGQYTAKLLELNEITNYIMLSQIATSSSFTDSRGLPPLVQHTDLSAVVQIDQCLTKLEKGVGLLHETETSQRDIDDDLKSQSIIFRLRMAHARVLLFRPFLARFCLPQITSVTAVQGLEARMLEDCATQCVENAQKMVILMSEDCRTDATPGIFPWWHRIFYLYIATQHLIAAMTRPHVFKPMVSDYWDKAIATLCAHEHLSPSIQRCITSFRSTWQKVTDIQNPPIDQAAPDNFRDVFQNLGFEFEDQTNFDMGDMNSLVGLDWNPDPLFGGSHGTSNLLSP